MNDPLVDKGFFELFGTPALVVGSKCYDEKVDRRMLYDSALGVDMSPGPGVDLVHDLEQPLPPEAGMFRHLDCVSVLEHVRNPFKFCESVVDSLLPGATVLVIVPWHWRIHGYPLDYWRFTPEAIKVLFPDVTWHFQKYLIEGKLRKLVPKITVDGVRYLARSELVMVGVFHPGGVRCATES